MGCAPAFQAGETSPNLVPRSMTALNSPTDPFKGKCHGSWSPLHAPGNWGVCGRAWTKAFKILPYADSQAEDMDQWPRLLRQCDVCASCMFNGYYERLGPEDEVAMRVMES